MTAKNAENAKKNRKRRRPPSRKAAKREEKGKTVGAVSWLHVAGGGECG
jgi:hypothetical protein